MRYEDLPAAARARVDAQLGRTARKRASQGSVGGACLYRCRACGLESLTWPKAERHARVAGHVRQEMVLGT